MHKLCYKTTFKPSYILLVYFSKTVLISFRHTRVNSKNVYIFVHICKRWPDVLLKVDVSETHSAYLFKIQSFYISDLFVPHQELVKPKYGKVSSGDQLLLYSIHIVNVRQMKRRCNLDSMVLIFNRTYLVRIIRHQMFLKIFVVLNCYSIYRS